jgi:hypothetical protein
MNTETDLQIQIGDLFNQLSYGWLSYSSAKQLYESIRDKKVHCARVFFYGSYLAHIDQSLRILGRLVSETGGLPDFLRAAGENPQFFRLANPQQILASVEGHDALVERLAQRVHGIQAERSLPGEAIDEVIDDDFAILNGFSPASLVEIEAGYQELLQALNTYVQFLGIEKYGLKQLSEDVEDDVQFLMTLMRTGCY